MSRGKQVLGAVGDGNWGELLVWVMFNVERGGFRGRDGMGFDDEVGRVGGWLGMGYGEESEDGA